MSARTGTTPLARRRPRGIAPLTPGLLAVLLALSGCGSEDPGTVAGPVTSSGPGAAGESTSSAPQETTDAGGRAESATATLADFSITLGEDSYRPGSHTFTVVNEGDATHDFVVERDGEDVAGTAPLAPGEEATLTVDLSSGKYAFYCSIANHRAMGMETTVQVVA